MKIRTETIKAFKKQRPISCLTSYDSITAEIFDRAGIDLILVGDSAANTVLGKPTTLPVTLDEMITFGTAVASVVEKAMVVIDMPFGSYEISPEEALRNSIEVMKKTGAEPGETSGVGPGTYTPAHWQTGESTYRLNSNAAQLYHQ